MKQCLTLIFILIGTRFVSGQGFDYNAVLKNQFLNSDAKTGLQELFKGRQLSDVFQKANPEAQDTLDRYYKSLLSAHLSGPYSMKEFDLALSKANINIDAGLKRAANIAADKKQPEAKRIPALQMVFGLSRLIYRPLPINSIAQRDEFIKHDIFLDWKNLSTYRASLTAYQLYDAYKLGLRLAQSHGNKQLTDYFRSKENVDAVSRITTYLNQAFYILPTGRVTFDEPVDGGTGDGKIYEPGEKEPVYGTMATMAFFREGPGQFYQVMNLHLEYPAEEWNRGIEGVVYVQFDVEKDGSVSHFKILRSLTPGTDSAVVRAARYLPKLIPGHLPSSSDPVRTFQVFRVVFEITPNVKREDAFKVLIKK